MDLSLASVAGILSRWLHVSAVVTLAGGVFYACVLARAGRLPDGAGAGFRPGVWVLVAVLFVSGIYNLLTKDVFPEGYQIVFGVKFLLVLHVVAVTLVAARRGVPAAKAARLLSGASFSGLAILLLSAFLRHLSAGAR